MPTNTEPIILAKRKKQPDTFLVLSKNEPKIPKQPQIYYEISDEEAISSFKRDFPHADLDDPNIDHAAAIYNGKLSLIWKPQVDPEFLLKNAVAIKLTPRQAYASGAIPGNNYFVAGGLQITPYKDSQKEFEQKGEYLYYAIYDQTGTRIRTGLSREDESSEDFSVKWKIDPKTGNPIRETKIH